MSEGGGPRDERITDGPRVVVRASHSPVNPFRGPFLSFNSEYSKWKPPRKMFATDRSIWGHVHVFEGFWWADVLHSEYLVPQR